MDSSRFMPARLLKAAQILPDYQKLLSEHETLFSEHQDLQKTNEQLQQTVEDQHRQMKLDRNAESAHRKKIADLEARLSAAGSEHRRVQSTLQRENDDLRRELELIRQKSNGSEDVYGIQSFRREREVNRMPHSHLFPAALLQPDNRSIDQSHDLDLPSPHSLDACGASKPPRSQPSQPSGLEGPGQFPQQAERSNEVIPKPASPTDETFQVPSLQALMPTGICDWATIRAAMKKSEPGPRKLAIKAKQNVPAIHEDDISTQVSDIDIEHDQDQTGGAHNSTEEFPDDSLDRTIARDLVEIDHPTKKSLFVKLPVSQYNNGDRDRARMKTDKPSRGRIEKTRVLSPSKLVNRQSPTKHPSRRVLPPSLKPEHVPINGRRKSKRIRGQLPEIPIPRSPVVKVAQGHPSRTASARQLATGPEKENNSPSETRAETQRRKRPQTAAVGRATASKKQRILR